MQVAAGFINGDASGAVFAADASPKSMVAVEGDNLERWAFEGVKETSDGGAESGEIGRGVGDAAEAFGRFVGPVEDGVRPGIDDVDRGVGLELRLERRAEGEKGGDGEVLGLEGRKEFGEAGVVIGGSCPFELGEVRGADEQDVGTVKILSEKASGVENRLEYLVKRGELNRP